jgi:hypothetical protein
MNLFKIKQKVIVDKNLKADILRAMGLHKDQEGYLVYSATGDRALSANGKNIKYNDFGGIYKGSTILIKSDIDSVFEFVEKSAEA